MYNVFMAQNYDNMAKNLLSEYATEISQFVLGVNDVENTRYLALHTAHETARGYERRTVGARMR